MDFDADNIQKSVTALIAGLKTAIWASACGVFWAVTFKVREIFLPEKIDPKASGATVEDLITAINQANNDNNSHLDSLKSDLNNFYETQVANNSNALIDALEKVMRDFNSIINEQFGENFKQLNKAVTDILIWQEQYRQQIAEMITQQSQAATNMEIASLAYQTILKEADKFNIIADNMTSSLTGLNEQQRKLDGSLSQLDGLIMGTVTGLPDIGKKIATMVEQVQKGVTDTNNEFRISLINTIATTSDALKTAINENAKESNTAIRRANKEFNDNINAQINKLDAALTDELNVNKRQTLT